MFHVKYMIVSSFETVSLTLTKGEEHRVTTITTYHNLSVFDVYSHHYERWEQCVAHLRCIDCSAVSIVHCRIGF